jgi:hypothetical protein
MPFYIFQDLIDLFLNFRKVEKFLLLLGGTGEDLKIRRLSQLPGIRQVNVKQIDKAIRNRIFVKR